MGCNIHGFIEVEERIGWYAWVREPMLDRNYKLFCILAGVRCYDSPSYFTPRGLPDDVTYKTRELLEDDPDIHSISYWTAKEFLSYEWGDILRDDWQAFYDIMKALVNIYGTDNVRFVFGFDN